MKQDLNIQYELLREKLSIIESDINEIESILEEVEKANGSLDDRVWMSSEKTKMDQEFIPYLEKISKNAPSALRKNLNYIRKSVNIYETTEKELIEEIDDKLTDLSRGE